MGYFKWKPSKAQKKEFKEKMDEIERFCEVHGISSSISKDSYYFTVNGQNYRVSNHSVESSPYHPFGRLDDVKYIHASKTRIMKIYNNILAGKELNGHGCVIE
jgi:hypothetical protein